MSHHPITSWLAALAFLAILGAGGIFFILAVRMRVRQLLMAGRPEVRWDAVGQRLKNFVVYVMAQKKLPRHGYWYSGLLHIFIFGAFMVLSVDTVNYILDALIKVGGVATGGEAGPAFHLPLTTGPYEALADTFRFLCIVGVGMAFLNRMVFKPKRLHLSRDAMYTLFFILGLMLFEVAQIGFDLAIQGHAKGLVPPNHTWFSNILAQLVVGADEGSLRMGYQAAWWCHLVNLLAFTNYVPYSKHSHVFASPLNMFFMDLAPKGRIRTLKIDPEAEDVEYFGARSLEDLSWKQVFDGLSCTECGRCTDHCPANQTGKLLSPKHLTLAMRDYLYHNEQKLVAGGNEQTGSEGGDSKKVSPADPLVPEFIKPEVLWACVTCFACETECPVFISYVDKIVDLRRNLVMEKSEFPAELQNAFQGIERNANPWSFPPDQRAAWAEGLDVPRMMEKQEADVLLWIGCSASFDERAKKIARATACLLKAAGVDFAILGEEEMCTGDPARRAGNEFLFQMMAQTNIETLSKYKFNKIVTVCPHCYNTLGNEYPDFGGKYAVVHHSQLLSQLVRQGKLKPRNPVNSRVVYHDSCYLGRYNEVYEEPRDALRAIPGLTLLEPAKTRDRGMCCGAGGAQMFKEEEHGAERINQRRVQQLLDTGAQTVASACPFCQRMLIDGLADKSREDVPELDIAELLWKSVESAA